MNKRNSGKRLTVSTVAKKVPKKKKKKKTIQVNFFLLDYVLQKFEYKNQVNFFNLILYTSTILSNYKTSFFSISNICHPLPLDYTLLIGQRINGKDIEFLLPNINDLRLTYNAKAGYICTPGRLGLLTI
jgi:hypothetical protein